MSIINNKQTNIMKNILKNLGIIEIPMTNSRQKNLDTFGDLQSSCICCGKPTNQKLWINTVEGPDAVFSHITEEDMAAHDKYTQGCFPVGPDCAKKFPKGYVSSPEWTKLL